MLLPLSFKHTAIFPGLSDLLFTWCLRTAFFQIGDFWCKLFAKASLILVEPHANILPDIWILLLKSHVREWTALHILTTGNTLLGCTLFLFSGAKCASGTAESLCMSGTWTSWEPQLQRLHKYVIAALLGSHHAENLLFSISSWGWKDILPPWNDLWGIS